MNSVTRKLTLGLAVAIAATACGDNVTVKQQGPPPATVRSVVVSPSSATIAAGSSFTFGAAVDADSGLSRAVTWTAAGGTGITVDANGVATSTATATGVASVCATSVANTAIKGCAQLTVNAVAAATVQIDVITYGCDAIALAVSPVACNLQAAVTPSNIAGEVDVQALVNRPAGSGQQNVVFQVLDGTGTTVQDSYTQTLLADVDLGAGIAAQQTTNNRVTQAIQTAKYDLTGTGGIAKVYFPNGQHVIRVCLSATPNTCAGSGTTAVALTTLTFRNANGFHVTTTTNLASGNNGNLVPVRATTAAGLAWNGGTGLALKAVPVSYTGTVPAAVTGTTVGFGSGCDLVLGARGIAATITGGILTGSLPYANVTGAAGVGIAGAANLNQYEMNPACGGESPFATANDATGNSFINFSLFGPFGANNTLNVAGGPLAPTSTDFAPVIRLDNRGPSTGALTFTDGTVGNPINGRTNAWVNGDVVLNGANTGATSNGAVLTTPTDAGFGGTVSRIAHLGTAAACNNAANCLGQPTVTQASSPTFAETVTNTTDAFNVEAQDVFGNRVVVAPQLVGLDFTAPTIANNGSPADAAVIDAAATNFSVNVADALSGFAATGSVSESVVRVNGALGGLTRTNVVGTGAISATPFATEYRICPSGRVPARVRSGALRI